MLTPFSWGSLKTNIGTDAYTNQNLILAQPGERTRAHVQRRASTPATTSRATSTSQTMLNFNSRQLTKDISLSAACWATRHPTTSRRRMASMGHELPRSELRLGQQHAHQALQPADRSRSAACVSGFGSGDGRFHDSYLYLTATGRNDWTSTIPTPRNSFFYPSISGSFIFSDAFPATRPAHDGKLRAAYAEVGKDARPYAYRPSLESKTTSYGGYGYGFTGPNPRPQARVREVVRVRHRVELPRRTASASTRPCTEADQDQIVNDIRGSYATGFVLLQPERRRDAQPAVSRSRCAARRSAARRVSVGHPRELRERTSARSLALPNDCCPSPTSRTRGSTATCVTAPRRAVDDVAHRPRSTCGTTRARS